MDEETIKPEHWNRENELLFRTSEILLAKICNNPEIQKRRKKVLTEIGVTATSCSKIESSRFSSESDSICDYIAKSWIKLFDKWESSKADFIFEDGYELLFFLRILYANEHVLLRGQYNHTWKLIPKAARYSDKTKLDDLRKKAMEFLDEIKEQEWFKKFYPVGISDDKVNAILQHYGFPTHLLDLTFSFDVALYFAEGGKDTEPLSKTTSEFGSIYAFPIDVLADNMNLVTLSPAIMRPNLQKGAFLKITSEEELNELEKHKYIFKHQRLPIWNGMSGITFGSTLGLGSYLFPFSDPINLIANKYLKGEDNRVRVGDIPVGTWLNTVVNEIGECDEGEMVFGRILYERVKNERIEAFKALKLMAENIEDGILEQEDVDILIGAIFFNYVRAFSNFENGDMNEYIPIELLKLIERFPFIPECVSYYMKNTEFVE